MKDINRNDWMKFELYIMDFLTELDINSGSDLSDIAEQLHEHMETAIQDYANDEDIYDDYEPTY